MTSCKKAATPKSPESINPSNPGNTNTINPDGYDIVIYGATSSGIIAAVQASKLGKSVILVSNYSRIGGMTTNGLSNTDIGEERIIGGLAGDFYKRIGKYYGNNAPVYRFEPKAALQVFNSYIIENNITVLYNERLMLKTGVEKTNSRITAVILESGKKITGKIFLDTSYEGDLMAQTGVSYAVGRENTHQYNESLNGITKPTRVPIDPYVKEGDPKSGILPRINLLSRYEFGAKSDLVMSYNFRLCLTDNDGNKTVITKPTNYNELEYEMLFRALKNDPKLSLSSMVPLPSRKWDTNATQSPFSLNYVGGNSNYVEADYTTREQIKQQHQTYEQGLIWTLQNDERVPTEVRKFYSKYGLAKDEFLDNNNWPNELYIREARRMIGMTVITQNTVLNKEPVTDPIGMGSYPIDCHNVQLFLTNAVYAEGYIEYWITRPYGISYRAIVPQTKECTNLLVPVCLSASHVAFSSLRMEPQYMMLGQSAAIAASLAIDNNINVQDVDYTKLQPSLISNQQRLTF